MTDKERAKDFVKTMDSNPKAVIRWANTGIKVWNIVANETNDKQISDWALSQKDAYTKLVKLIRKERIKNKTHR
jgi:hypothetical protein